ncbi:unnamed protein product [Arctia plantaginis]|uniref:Uncharacterized protein n=1 Tax=Arctia plantaginis TaxID=874455 RepID=A0A8S0ZHH9_ARCPL|nr:unnamed protein product [Arctia plantaginis]
MDGDQYCNITYRKKQTPKLNVSLTEETAVDIENSSLLDSSVNSLPATSKKDYTLLEEYEEIISTLKLRLASANEEIENLNLQNIQLKMSVEKSSKVIALYKKIGITENLLNAVSTPVIRKVKKVFSCVYPVSPRHSIPETNEISTQTTGISMTKHLGKPFSFKTCKQQIKKRRRKINYLTHKISILKTQNKKTYE